MSNQPSFSYLASSSGYSFQISQYQDGLLGLDDTLKSLQKDVKIAELIKEQKLKVQALESIALIYFNQQQYDETLSTLQEILEVAKSTQDQNQKCAALLSIAIVYQKINQMEQAIDYLEQCSSAVGQTGNLDHTIRWLMTIGNVYYDEMLIAQTLEHYEKALRCIEEHQCCSAPAEDDRYWRMTRLLRTKIDEVRPYLDC